MESFFRSLEITYNGWMYGRSSAPGRPLYVLLMLLLPAALAHAEPAAAPTAAKLDPARCTHEQVPYLRDSRNEAIKRLAPKGLYLRQAAGRRHLLFATSFGTPKRSVVIERDSGKSVVTLPLQDTALVEDPSGRLLYVLSLEELGPGKRRLQLHAPDGAPRWKQAPVLQEFGDSASVLVADELLLVAHFHRIATGSSLHAFDLQTGTPRWRADVQQLQVAHSKYWNDVAIERAGSTLILRGMEAGGCYLQTFELATGRRLSSQLQQP